MSTATKLDSAKKTIGVFASQVGRAWGAEFMAGVTAAAEAHDVNLVHFIGGKLSALITPDKPQASYGLYDLARQGLVDGLILTADVAYGLSVEDLRTFYSVYGSVPIVTQAVPVEGASMFIADNMGGMHSVVKHLVEKHGYKRIAFIRGINHQIDAEQRYQAYLDEIKAQGIRFEGSLVVDGDFSSESGRAAIHTLMDERGMRFQAVVAANDRMAFGALEALQARGVRVPDDVAVTGFDDLREAQTMGVPLTTVRQSFYTAGRNAFEALLQKIEGRDVPATTVTATQLLIRWSCGCLPENVIQASVLPRDVAKTGRLDNKREAALQALLYAAGVTEGDPALSEIKSTFLQMWDSFLGTLRDQSGYESFLKLVNATIDVLQKHGRGPSIWHNVISRFRLYALGGITSHTAMLRAENLFQQARLLAGELSQRVQAYRRLEIEKQEEVLQGFGFSMAPAMSLEEIGTAISQHFPVMGIERWYVMFYSDVSAPQSISTPPPESYRLLAQYDHSRFEIPREPTMLGTGRLIPRGKTPEDHRYTAVVMPLALASNRFGFMWVEIGPPDWEVYVRIRNLVSSALLRTMLVSQREQARKEVERLLQEARERTAELAVAKEWADKAAAENAKLYDSEQTRRRAAEALAKASRQLSSLASVEQVPQQIIEQLAQIVPNTHSALFMEDVNQVPRLLAHRGLPKDAPVAELQYELRGTNMYDVVAKQAEPMLIGDVDAMKGWVQPVWLPADRSWLGVPLYSKNMVTGMLVLARSTPAAFNQDDVLTVSTFSVQAAIALENARLYDDLTRFNQMMERMVAQRVEELNDALTTLEQLDRNKSDFIQVAAHELRTPLTVIKGYMGMIKAAPSVQSNPSLMQAVEGVMQGTNRLHQVVNSMLDVVRLESQVLTPHLEQVMLGPIVRLIQKEYAEDLAARHLTLKLDEVINALPPLMADPELLQKALNNLVVNAIKFTPDGGTITISARPVNEENMGRCAEVCVHDTGIGIDPANYKIIFEKLYQLGKADLHSSSRTNFKGGGPGLGLAIAAGIVKAHHGKIWVESPGYDEEKLPGSTFFVRIPLAKQ